MGTSKERKNVERKNNKKNPKYPMFIAALFTMARTWKQPIYSLMEGWIKKMWYVHTLEYYSAIKRAK